MLRHIITSHSSVCWLQHGCIAAVKCGLRYSRVGGCKRSTTFSNTIPSSVASLCHFEIWLAWLRFSRIMPLYSKSLNFNLRKTLLNHQCWRVFFISLPCFQFGAFASHIPRRSMTIDVALRTVSGRNFVKYCELEVKPFPGWKDPRICMLTFSSLLCRPRSFASLSVWWTAMSVSVMSTTDTFCSIAIITR